MLEIEAIHQHRRALTAGALYLLSATEGPIPADPLITAVAADIDALLARVAALETLETRAAELRTAATERLDRPTGNERDYAFWSGYRAACVDLLREDAP